jgi:hypothetical protein
MGSLAISLQALLLGLVGFRFQLDGARKALGNYILDPVSRQFRRTDQDGGAGIIVKPNYLGSSSSHWSTPMQHPTSIISRILSFTGAPFQRRARHGQASMALQ